MEVRTSLTYSKDSIASRLYCDINLRGVFGNGVWDLDILIPALDLIQETIPAIQTLVMTTSAIGKDRHGYQLVQRPLPHAYTRRWALGAVVL